MKSGEQVAWTSKSFTGLAVAQLAQDGKVDLDAPVVLLQRVERSILHAPS